MKSRTRRTSLFLTCALGAGLVALNAAPASAAPQAAPEPGVYNLLNEERGLQCLAGRSNNTVTIFNCIDSYTDQYWRLEPLPLAGYFRFRNVHTGKCLAMSGWGNGDRASGYECIDSYNDQWWKPEPTLASNAYQLRNHKTGKCLVAREKNGRATQYDCVLNYKDQWWNFFHRGSSSRA
ncbi:hypothetical protein D0T12_00985 [Actinomadura spongiicola]|uniref:Ricin B lectin domain-containing protein n=1 Tax=Actinomadura spongiicola TaxID=2303421 RepID=A0A372GP78_9ACTN|nr:RICIN domain-containing protein [Actinomadura spongiicola]RFS86883.1 hypothetical protein D0T12_00985 [Actinomadura spongiicola]